ncbi:MAG: Diaminopimelate decarboxylase [Synergistetes bacterium ADurb.BinA166]|nr:MAG: Diaminopimelate decarboxylase [Synergistetes bacterium ADurb.BinA166]
MGDWLAVNEKGRLVLEGWDSVELAGRFGTPLYVLSEGAIRRRCGELRETFIDRWENASAVYAGKAFLTLAMCRIVQSEGLGLDLVSGGELFTASAAGFPLDRALLHGNGKTGEELALALASGVGRIVVDSLSELETLEEVASSSGRTASVLLRVSPGVDPHTHRYIVTGHTGSKFGFPVAGDSLREAVRRAMGSSRVRLKGFHFHIGSQIFEKDSHVMSVDILTGAMAEFRRDLGLVTEELNMGGGFGVDFTQEGRTPRIEEFTDAMMARLSDRCLDLGMERPRVVIEPGRWIVSEAGVTLYSVQTVKRLDGGLTYVAVDGGMSDNPRPSLYGAKYRAVAAGSMKEEATEVVTLAGKCCESGDILVEGMRTPPLSRGDIVAVLNTGAYTFSMASNYNRIPRPAAVLVSPGRADVIAERQTYDDVLRWDRIPEHLR